MLAIDGSPPAETAVRAARAFARRTGASVVIATVYTPEIPLPESPERHGIERCQPSHRQEVAELIREVRAQLASVLTEAGHLRDWPLHLEIGDPGPMIVSMARHTSADLIVLSIGAREPSDRLSGTRTAAIVARYATVPLYASAAGCEVAARCVAAFPDGRPHAPTIHAALASLLLGGRLWVAMPATTDDGVSIDTSESARNLVARACGPECMAYLDAVEVERVILPGEPLTAVTALAQQVDAQLIAIPNHGDPGPVRAFLPNLVEPLLLASRCSLLVVPA